MAGLPLPPVLLMYHLWTKAHPYDLPAMPAFHFKHYFSWRYFLNVKDAPPALRVRAFHLSIDHRLPALIWNKGTSLPLPVPFIICALLVFSHSFFARTTLNFHSIDTIANIYLFCQTSTPAFYQVSLHI